MVGYFSLKKGEYVQLCMNMFDLHVLYKNLLNSQSFYILLCHISFITT